MGGTSQRVKLSHLNDCIERDTDVVINCTGVHARTFGGVEDEEVYPTGGQLVIMQLPRTHLNWAFLKHPAFSNNGRPLSGIQILIHVV
ncbi:MAG TPA: hypothetical protein VJ697_09145 [Nitrososphaeraceae archaeon]|nr:hypothetical protein [Nitrososphaeraceae archaeon]